MARDNKGFTEGGDKMMTATMRLGAGRYWIEFQDAGADFRVEANMSSTGIPGGTDQRISFTLNEAQRRLLLELVKGTL